MSFGKMNTFIELVTAERGKDSEGFAVIGDQIVATFRAYREDRRGTAAWANRAAFSTASAMFRFRMIPGVTLDTSHVIVCADGRYKILSVENVKGRGLYCEVLAEKQEPAAR